MKSQTVLSSALLLGMAAAAPATTKLGRSNVNSRMARRANAPPARSPRTMIKSNSTSIADIKDTFAAAAQVSENWTGAVLESPPSGEYFSSAVGTFTIPTPSGSGSGAAWVGIDGDTCQSAIIQAGVDWTISNGKSSYQAWYEWYPAYSYDFSLEVTAGDVITVTIDATSDTAGKVIVESKYIPQPQLSSTNFSLLDVSTGKSATESFTNADSTGGDLCRTNAEWIVEDYTSGSSLVELADWGTVTFTDSSAGTTSGTSVGLTGATVIDLESSSGKVISSVDIESASEVKITYTG